GVKIWRPLLPYAKDVVFQFAHRYRPARSSSPAACPLPPPLIWLASSLARSYGIPYTLDTTPRWSVRGRLRRELQPLLASLVGAGYLKNLTSLGRDSAELHTILYDLLFKPVWDSVQRTEVAVHFRFDKSRPLPRLFWKETLRHVLHSMGQS